MRKSRFLLAALGAVPALGLMMPAASAAHAPKPATAAVCSGSLDAYTASPATRAECGIAAFPLVRTSRLAGGGTSYHYDVAGRDTWINRPPAHFDAATASAAELARYGIDRPAATDRAALARWRADARRWTWGSAPKVLYSLPAGLRHVGQFPVPPGKATHWAGYIDGSPAGVKPNFTQAEINYIEPVDGPSVCGNADAAMYWAGLGGANGAGSDLAQAGTSQGADGLGQDQAWYEVLPAAAVAIPQAPLGGAAYFKVSAGQQLQVKVKQSLSAGTYSYQFTWTNVSDRSLPPFSVNASPGKGVNYSGAGQSADFIAERPFVGNKFTDLTNFATMTLEGARVFKNYASKGKPISNYSYISVTMTDPSEPIPTMATPSTLVPFGDAFTITQDSCE